MSLQVLSLAIVVYGIPFLFIEGDTASGQA